MPLLLTEEDVRRVLSMPDLIQAMRTALIQFSTGAAQQPVRTVLEVGAQKAFFGVMPAELREPPALGTKLVTVFGSNRERGIPTHLATILLHDPGTGALLAVMDGRYITESRTAAVSAVSVDLLARAGARSLAILGSGIQARSHLQAVQCVRSLECVRVWSPTPSRLRAFVDETARAGGVPATAAISARDAVAGADIIVLATSSATPVLMRDWVGDGAHICAVGACRPNHREMPAALVAAARVFVDSRQGAFAEAGDIVLAIVEGVVHRESIAGELGELAAGTIAGRQTDRQITLFKSLGMAVEDVAAAHLTFLRAAARGLGTEVAI
jgi:ornithine cyclodeaminase